MSEKLVIENCTWDSQDIIKIYPTYTEWKSEHGNTDLMQIEAHSKKYNDSISISICLEDMLDLYEFLGGKIKIAKESGYYEDKTFD